MSGFEDQRVVFYLKHRELIDTWAALRKEASKACNDFMATCSKDIDSLSQRVTPEASFSARMGLNPGLLLHLPEWMNNRGYPRVEIGLEWPKNEVLFAGPKPPYSGIRVDRSQKGGAALAKRLRRLLDGVSIDGYKKGKANGYWVLFRYEEADSSQKADASHPEYWEDLGAYREQLVEGVQEAWDRFWQVVESAVEDADGDSEP